MPKKLPQRLNKRGSRKLAAKLTRETRSIGSEIRQLGRRLDSVGLNPVARELRQFARGFGFAGNVLRSLGALGDALEILMGGEPQRGVGVEQLNEAVELLRQYAPELLRETAPEPPPLPGEGAERGVGTGTGTDRGSGRHRSGERGSERQSDSETGGPKTRKPRRPGQPPGAPPSEETHLPSPDPRRPPTGKLLGGVGIDMKKVSGSSNVYAYGYDEETLTLRVQYLQSQFSVKGRSVKATGHRSGPGPVYDYYGVEPTVFRRMDTAGSKGKAVWDLLRVRGTAFGHRYDFKLVGVTMAPVVREGRDNVSFEYVPRRGISAGVFGQRTLSQGPKKIRSTLSPTKLGPGGFKDRR